MKIKLPGFFHTVTAILTPGGAGPAFHARADENFIAETKISDHLRLSRFKPLDQK
jgi:hypothetical protein